MSSPSKRALRIDDPVAAATTPNADVELSAPVGTAAGRLRDLPLEQIHPNPRQPRNHFDDTALTSLADSIRARGVLQPVIVRPAPSGGYELVAGERRWKAAQLADQTTLPALIDQQLDDGDSLELALIENVARQDLTPIEEARTIGILLDDLAITAGDLAKRLGKSRTDLVHTVRLLDLPDHAIELIDTGKLTKGHGKALLTEPDQHRRMTLATRAAEQGWSVRRLQAEIAAQASGRRRASREPHPDALAAATRLEDAISKATGATATARPHRDGYELILILDQAAAERLAQLLDPTTAPISGVCHVAHPASRQAEPAGTHMPTARVASPFPAASVASQR